MNDPRVITKAETLAQVDAELHDKAVAILEADPALKSYQTACRRVLASDPDLFRRYALAGPHLGVA